MAPSLTKEALPMFYQPTLPIFDEYTGSPASPVGSTPCSLPDGPTNGPYGRGRVPANPTAPPAKAKATTTPAISGPSSFGSSASVALTSFLANRLKTQLGTDGSMEYRQTWKEKATPLGRVYWAHTASARRTSGNGCSGWPSPAVQNAEAGPNPLGNVGEHFTLQTAAGLAGWNMPRAMDGSKGGPNQSGGSLPADAALAGWATPANRDYRYPNNLSYQERSGTTKGEQLNNQVVHGLTSSLSPAETASSVASVLNPAMSRWLMGFPATWDAASPHYAAWQSTQEAIASDVCAATETP